VHSGRAVGPDDGAPPIARSTAPTLAHRNESERVDRVRLEHRDPNDAGVTPARDPVPRIRQLRDRDGRCAADAGMNARQALQTAPSATLGTDAKIRVARGKKERREMPPVLLSCSGAAAPARVVHVDHRHSRGAVHSRRRVTGSERPASRLRLAIARSWGIRAGSFVGDCSVGACWRARGSRVRRTPRSCHGQSAFRSNR
jgi:hypothetical protein